MVDVNQIITIGGKSVTIKQALIALAPILEQIDTEWTGYSKTDYVKFLSGLKQSQYK